MTENVRSVRGPKAPTPMHTFTNEHTHTNPHQHNARTTPTVAQQSDRARLMELMHHLRERVPDCVPRRRESHTPYNVTLRVREREYDCTFTPRDASRARRRIVRMGILCHPFVDGWLVKLDGTQGGMAGMALGIGGARVACGCGWNCMH